MCRESGFVRSTWDREWFPENTVMSVTDTPTNGSNGHAPGGVWLHLGIGGGLLYMGDCSVESSLYAFDPPPPATSPAGGTFGRARRRL